ncbi:hypothetical protein BTA30_22320, partial [Bacillus swezeyi]
MEETLDLKESLNLQNQLKQLRKENKKLKADLHQYELMFNGTLDAIFILDQQMKIVQANDAACNILQSHKKNLLNRSALDFLHA